MSDPQPAFLVLETGEVFEGHSFGYSDPKNPSTPRELVFSTGMVGYVESMTDPSFKNQILVLTYPLIGNYGVPDRSPDPDYPQLLEHFESNRIHVSGLVIGESAGPHYSHWKAHESLNDWLIREKILAIQGIDTRALTKIIREQGVLKALLITNQSERPTNPCELFQITKPLSTPNPQNLVAQVTTSKPYRLQTPDYDPKSGLKVLVIDCGLKQNQLRCFLKHSNLQLQVVPYDYDFTHPEIIDTFDRLFLSNGPGDPRDCEILIERLRFFLEREAQATTHTPTYSPTHSPRPVFGICLGHQLLALAIGAKTYKMKYGNRGLNLPCQLAQTQRCLVTSQNHGYAVDATTLPSGWHELFRNANDLSNEGLYHESLPFYSVQFHPEAKPGPEDSEFLFSFFLQNRFSRIWEYLTGVPKPDFQITPLDPTCPSQLSKPDFSDKKKVLILGSGGLSIGQSGEFDYSGSQAIKAYQEEGLQTVLINPNIATVQTSPGFADKVYFLPIEPEHVIKVIKVERPDCISLSFGGQTALNCGVQLYQRGIFEKYQIQILGSPVESVIDTEDRERFKQRLLQIREPFIPSQTAESFSEALTYAQHIGFPLLVRAAYALGGLGSGFANNEEELRSLLEKAFAHSNQVILDRSLRGWKEVEYEVVRDRYDNCICVCNMENLDPLGIHTGESIVIAPSQTLDDHDYQMLRTSALKTIRSLKVVGECNIQFALDPNSRQYYIVEVNARLSRSSALASKATGYPLAHVAAKLSLGYSLFQLPNSMTKKTCALFEPSLDYCVLKVPRWDLRKFPQVDTHLDSSMKSIGESMAIARSFREAFQKALRMADDQILGFQPNLVSASPQALRSPTHQRMSALATALYQSEPGYSIDQLYQLTRIDRWYLYQLQSLIDQVKQLEQFQQEQELPFLVLRACKRAGFSDKQIGEHCQSTEIAIRNQRTSRQLHPWVKQVDTVSAEFPCFTNYLYTTYSSAQEHDVLFDQKTTIIVGSGVYKIGSSVEFDWCCVNAVRALRQQCQRHTTMINCNPETVSTDYDEADRLYFEELSFESVMDIYSLEQPEGIVLSMGGQVANNMAMALYRQYVKVIGTSPEVIDIAENRFKFSRLLDKLEIRQPRWKELTSIQAALDFCHEVSYPCLIRPSYVLSGAAMNVCYSDEELLQYLKNAQDISKDHPVVISQFISDAKEIEVDAIAHNHQIKVMAISEHVENAGVHSGDSTIILPAQDLTPITRSRIEEAVRKLVQAIDINGPFNMQFMVKDDQIQVIECNLRVSRTFPFISKTLNLNFVEVAIDAMLNRHQLQIPKKMKTHRIGIKVPKFSFSRLKKADFTLGVEMVSTGEVACYGRNKYDAYLKALQATDVQLPIPARESPNSEPKGILISMGTFRYKSEFLQSARQLSQLGYRLYGTRGTTDFYREQGLSIQEVTFPSRTSQITSADPHSFYHLVNSGQLHFILNVSRPGLPGYSQATSDSNLSTYQPSYGYLIRRTAVDHSIPLLPDIKIAKLFVQSLVWFHQERQDQIWIDTTIDCITSRRIVRLPGLIDVHVHLREPGASHKEDWSTGTQAALAGGITTVAAMPNTDPAITNQDALELVEQIADEKAHCDYLIFLGAGRDNTETIHQLASRAAGLKMYLNNTYGPLLLQNTLDWSEHLQHWPKAGNQSRIRPPICVHAEAQTLPAILHLANLHQQPIHVCHVARRSEIEIIKLSKQQGQAVTCEVAPHHLFLDESDLQQLKSCGGVKPPLMTLDDQQALWENLEWIDCFATDHAPHTIEEKEKGESAPPGFPGLETALPLLLTAVKAGRLTLDDIVQKYHYNPKRIFGLTDCASTDPENTYIEVDLDTCWTLPQRTKFSKAGWTPFAGRRVCGQVRRVVLRNKVVYVDGQILSSPGYGRNLREVYRSDRKLSMSPVIRKEDDSSSEVDETSIYLQEKKSLLSTPSLSTLSLSTLSHSTTEFKHLLSVDLLTKDQLGTLFDVADHLRAQKRAYDADPTNHPGISNLMTHKVLGLIFYEPSTRTRCSFSAAMQRLGGQVLEIPASESSVQKGESFSDFVKCIECYTDAIVIRNSQTESLPAIAQTAKVPIISAGDGSGEHPTQALLDAYTIRRERGTLNGLTIGLVGDLKHGRTVHSLAKLLSLYNVQLKYVSPPGLEMPAEIWEFVEARQVPQSEHQSINEILPEVDVLYMTRIQQERFRNDLDMIKRIDELLEDYQLSPKNLTRAKENVVIMHPLPRCREISPEIDNDPRAAYFRQMKNGMYVRMALLTLLLK